MPVAGLERFNGEIVRPGDAEYDAARVVWNGMVDRRPALVVRPADVEDVVTALRFARDRELVVAVRCGGHSIPGFSTCDDGIVIDLSRLRGAQLDAERRVARVAGGSLLAELDAAAQAHGLVCPVGVVSHTGVAGLTLGGGMGRLQRRFGLTIDNLLAVELVTADGRLVRASEDDEPELFWGLRGAGANFGIATAFELRLHPLRPEITFGTVTHPAERANDLADRYRELVEGGPDELWASFGLGLAGDDGRRPVVTVSVLDSGGPGDAAEHHLAALRSLPPPLTDSVRSTTYLAAQRASDEATAWGHRYYMKSAFLPALPSALVGSAFLPALPSALVGAWAGRLADVPEGADGGFSVWPMGRAIAAVSDEATAFTGRDAAFWAAVDVTWDDPALDDACRAWVRAASEDARPYASTGRYVNDEADVGGDLARGIYGQAKHERLVSLKRTWDPDNVFRLNQNIRP